VPSAKRNDDTKKAELCSLQQMIDDPEWCIDEERYYILEMDLGEDEGSPNYNKDEGEGPPRVFTQIRKLDIHFQEQPAKMLVIRNITFIIEYEKIKNANKYQELLTATTSHEMLTPLNSIINLSMFIEAKLTNRFKLELQQQATDGSKGGSTSEIVDIKQSLSFIHIIKSSAHILQYLIKDLIDLMNIKLNKFNAVSQMFNPSEACSEVLKCYEI
jgi:signal transduction histidine kinase